MRPPSRIAAADIDDHVFDAVIDVRSPAEYALDHLPGAINLPVLDDAERAEVGTLYKRRSPFEARRRGAGLVAANIARHMAGPLAQQPPGFRALLYCWRGGDRSASFASVLASVGWRIAVLDGGYRDYRKRVVRGIDAFAERAAPLWIVAGFTGSGKTWLLERLAEAGAQTVDLEALAAHRGSALGAEPGVEQPSQKGFESRLYAALEGLDPERPTFFESESSRVGRRQIPAELWAAMRAGRVAEVAVPRAQRARFLLSDYRHFVERPEELDARLEKVRPLQPPERFELWRRQRAAGDWAGFVESMLEHHYDPAYLRSREKTYAAPEWTIELDEVSEAELDRAAAALIDAAGE